MICNAFRTTYLIWTLASVSPQWVWVFMREKSLWFPAVDALLSDDFKNPGYSPPSYVNVGISKRCWYRSPCLNNRNTTREIHCGWITTATKTTVMLYTVEGHTAYGFQRHRFIQLSFELFAWIITISLHLLSVPSEISHYQFVETHYAFVHRKCNSDTEHLNYELFTYLTHWVADHTYCSIYSTFTLLLLYDWLL